MNLAEMTGVVYIVDTNSWIKVQDMNVPNDRREALWQRIEELVTAGRIRTVQVALEEAERNSPEAHNRLKAFKRHPGFELRKRDQIGRPQEVHILRELEQQSRSLARNRRGREKADAYLIAAAETRNLTVVSEEGNGRGKIPDICRRRNVACVTLLELIVREGLV